ncbi:Tetratricopeptide-like helical [Penicillium italicum]|uniref:Tetratricopeptide-like helical n=1 Tax=Penicillium italicum TaxID=40296 RepID=A0A0A2LCF6_PENIT|nr:Tetratricopeptide-like helical [Penicillium italicum]
MTSFSELKRTLTPALFDDVHKLWFDHLSCEEALILPGGSEMGKWFSHDEAFDKACVAQFRPALETIVDSGASASDILSAVSPSSPMDWISLIILLDQIPRNCYRGAESKLVFGRFDPLAEEIALRAVNEEIPTQSTYFKYRMAYRTWFHMPLMHSENLAVHEQAVKMHEDIARDLNGLLASDASTLTEEERKCQGVLSEKAEAVQAFLSNTSGFEKRHKVIIEQFGRYPHRNQALGRVSTPEEIEYLNNGGETFG